jgi:hypothetical protein
VLHIHSATGGRDPDQKHYLLTRNRWWTVIKSYPAPQLWLMLPLMIAVDAFSLLRGLIIYHSAMPIRARIDALRSARGMWTKRRSWDVNSGDG